MDKKKFDFKNVPAWWSICFNASCQSASQCLRHLAAEHAPEEVKQYMCVTPNAKGYGQRCELYEELRLVRVAYGFSHLFDNVLKRDDTPIRQTLISYFHGKRQYYWYFHGERPLFPEQMAYIQQLMERYGYKDPVVFDRYEEAYSTDIMP